MEESMKMRLARVGEVLARKGMVAGTAESCTAGLIAAEMASVPGASRWLSGGLVTYDTRWKVKYLGVSQQDVDRYDVVSEQVAREMTEGLMEHYPVNAAVTITGYAGPESGNPDIPVGTVYIGVKVKDENRGLMLVDHRCLKGDRNEVRRQAARLAIELFCSAVESIWPESFRDAGAGFQTGLK